MLCKFTAGAARPGAAAAAAGLQLDWVVSGSYDGRAGPAAAAAAEAEGATVRLKWGDDRAVPQVLAALDGNPSIQDCQPDFVSHADWTVPNDTLFPTTPTSKTVRSCESAPAPCEATVAIAGVQQRGGSAPLQLLTPAAMAGLQLSQPGPVCPFPCLQLVPRQHSRPDA